MRNSASKTLSSGARACLLFRNRRRRLPLRRNAQTSGLVLQGFSGSGSDAEPDVPGDECAGGRRSSGFMQPDSFGVGLTLVLASASPRRYQILSLLRVSFLMVPPRIIE